MAHKIDSPAARAKLAPRRAPYWHKVRQNHFVGWRYMTEGAPGNWMAKIKSGTAERFEPLGQLNDVDVKERFKTALAMANKWFDANGTTHVSASRITIADALRQYVEHKRKISEETGRAVRKRFELMITDFEIAGRPFVDMPIAKAKHDHFAAWRDFATAMPIQGRGDKNGQARKLSSVNRDCASFGAALNMAAERHKLPREEWRKALRRDLNADKGNRQWPIVRGEERAKLFAKMRELAPDMVPFALAQLVVPIRPGAWATVKVEHFNARAPSVYIEHDKAGADRHVPLPVDKAFQDLLKASAKNKTPGAYLFTRADGEQWDAEEWGARMRLVTTAAGLPNITMYSFRHTRITELIEGGMQIATVAKLAGTSVAQIEKHYYHLSDDTARAMLAQGVGDLMAA